MTKCLLKALKAVDLQNHVDLFRSLGYDSAGALAHFQKQHLQKLNLSEQELLRFHALLDVLKEATREGKICPHYSRSNKQSTIKNISNRSRSTEQIQQRNSQFIKTNHLTSEKRSNENFQSKKPLNSVGNSGRSTSTNKSHANGFILHRPSSNVQQQQKHNDQQFFGPKSMFNRPAVQHVKVKSYNYGVPTNKRQQNSSNRVHYQYETNTNHSSVFVPSSHSSTDIISYAKPAEIYVYARKRPLLSNETNFQDTISVADNKRIIISENKANLDCTPLLKKTEFHFDHVFGSDASNKQVFEKTVLPFLSPNQRHNLTYICFGQTGSGKSHTIFGSRTTDGLLIYCTQLLLQETNLQNKLICSFYEIYNNQVYDLTNTGKRLFVREDGEHHVNVVGITEINLRNLDTLRSVINDGLARRHHGKSAFNSNSSRSHAIFQIILKNSSNQAKNFRLIFIDLAGSERATDAQNNQKQTRREGAQINTSLLALKECIRSMDMTQSHAPFRQSKLTHILRDSLVGSKTRTCLMANVSPPHDCCQCTLNTLQYASRIRDISIRHRHRSLSMGHLRTNYLDDDNNDQQQSIAIVREKQQKTFRPATASTPVHRLVPSVDHRTYMTTNQTGINNHRRTNVTRKSSDIDWQIHINDDDDDDDDVPISGNNENHRIKSVLSSTREFQINSNTNHQNPTSSFYLTRYEQQRKKTSERDQSPSSYFPQPQTDIPKSSPKQTSEIKINQQWKTVPAPPVVATRQHSDSSSEPPSSTRIISIAPIQISDDNQYSSATGTESLGTKITKFATGVLPSQKTMKNPRLSENLNINLNKQYDTGTLTTTDTEQGFYSDRQATHRDQTGFFSNRDDPLFQNDIKSTHLTTITQRTSPTATPKTGSFYQTDALSTTSKKSFSSPNKIRHRTRSVKSASSSSSSSTSTSTINANPKTRRYSSPKRHHRPIPYHNLNSNNNKQHERKHSSIRNESCQTINKVLQMKNEQEQTDDQLLIEQFSDHTANNLMYAPLDQVKHLYDKTLSTSTPLISPSKEFGVHVSEQLNTLRTLLETRLKEQDEINHSTKDFSSLKTSPATFTKEFLQSYQYSKTKNSNNDIVSDLDDDDENKLHNRQRTTYYDYHHRNDALSSSATSSNRYEYLSNNHQNKFNPNTTLSSTTTVTPNIERRNDRNESRLLSNSANEIYSHHTNNNIHSTLIDNNEKLDNTSRRTSTTEQISEMTSSSQNPHVGASSDGSSITDSQSRLSNLTPPINRFPLTNNDDDDYLIDNTKSSSFLRGTSFDLLMNTLKTMREKDLDSLIHITNTDDNALGIID